VRRLTLVAAALLCLGIAVSRVYLGVHYPSDVVGALLAGTGWAALGVADYSPLDP
jgi:undecaprenyl-diphosphatase